MQPVQAGAHLLLLLHSLQQPHHATCPRRAFSLFRSWGGYFRILPPSSPGAVLNLGICAGCGQNVPGKGYYVGTGFSITFNNYAEWVTWRQATVSAAAYTKGA